MGNKKTEFQNVKLPISDYKFRQAKEIIEEKGLTLESFVSEIIRQIATREVEPRVNIVPLGGYKESISPDGKSGRWTDERAGTSGGWHSSSSSHGKTRQISTSTGSGHSVSESKSETRGHSVSVGSTEGCSESVTVSRSMEHNSGSSVGKSGSSQSVGKSTSESK
jgi:hypothetical protein